MHAPSWCMPEMRELLNDGRVHLVQGPMCHWRLASTGDGNEQGFVRGKTRWATSSSRLATLLAREHAGENRRVRLIGPNETIAGAMYSPRLVNTTDGWTTSVCTQLDRQQTFLSWMHENGKRTITISKEICLIQLKSRKEREKKSSASTTFSRVNVRNDKVDLTRWHGSWKTGCDFFGVQNDFWDTN